LLYGLAIEHAKAGRVDVACEWFDKCLAADAAYCYAYFHKGRTQLEAGRTSDGLATLRAGLVASAKHKDLKAMNELQALLDEHE
jgi:tetratricopeptide (TPR) repeat protein